MTRSRSREVEAELRAQIPVEIQSPACVRSRVLAAMDEPAAEPLSGRARLPVSMLPRLALGGVALAGIALAAALLLRPDPPTSRNAWSPSSLPVRLSLPDSVRLPATDALEDEARRIRRDMVGLTGLVRVPVQRLLEASRGPVGPA